MPRKSDRKPDGESPIRSRQQHLAQLEVQVKAQLNKTKQFLEKAPALKDEAQKKQQRELVERFNSPARIEGPVDFRLEFVNGKKSAAPPKRLRKERSTAPLFTFLLLVTFIVVAYFAWKSLAQG